MEEIIDMVIYYTIVFSSQLSKIEFGYLNQNFCFYYMISYKLKKGYL